MRHYNLPRPTERLFHQAGYTTSPYNRMWVKSLDEQVQDQLNKRSLSHADFFIGDPADGELISKIAGTPSEPSEGQIVKAIAALLLGVDSSLRATIMREALSQARGSKKPLVPLLASIPSGATVDQARKMLNGFFSTLLALGTANGSTTVNQLLRRADSVATGLPYAGDPTTLEPGEATLAQNIAAAAVVDPVVADELFSARFGPQLLKLADHYDCAVHVNPLGGGANLAYLQGGLLKNIGKAVSNFVKASPIGQAASAATQAAKGVIDAYANPQQSDAIRAGGGTAIASKQSLLDELDKLKFKDRKDWTLDEWWEDFAKQYPNDSSTELYAKVAAQYKKYHPDWDGPMEIAPDDDESGGSDSLSDSETDGKTNPIDNGPKDKDAILDEAMKGDSFSDLRSIIRQYSGQLEKIASKANAVTDNYRQAQYDLTKAMWMRAIADAPESVVRVLGKIAPDASTPTSLFSSILSLMPAMRSETSPRVMRNLLTGLNQAIREGNISSPDAETFMFGDPDGARATSVEDDVLSQLDQYWGDPAISSPSEEASAEDQEELES